ncbi:hypothetical protein HK414_08675 [Ramlibacter terrae]|uniref:Uncharacterized protein n=1 Tax=Ramlibacter terrae TaxID=2732511 RepID=A0ABX6P1Z4_9BURK|nr:hypothetical protein HK414_08675 [Ramlibacter terrae]
MLLLAQHATASSSRLRSTTSGSPAAWRGRSSRARASVARIKAAPSAAASLTQAR